MSRDLGDKLIFVNRTRVELRDLIVFGCTLHSVVPEGAHLTNDFALIECRTVRDHSAEHRKVAQWLEENLAEIAKSQPGCRIVIVTHYATAFEEASYQRHRQSTYRYCFRGNTLEQFDNWKCADQVTHWIFGHTHYNARFAHGDTLVVSNQPNDNDCLRKYDPLATI